MEYLGSLQLQVMSHVWQEGPTTVHATLDVLNSTRSCPLAYTTVLSVMRNLARRKLLCQSRKARTHIFSAMITEVEYKWKIIHHLSFTLFDDDIERMRAFVTEPEVIPSAMAISVRKSRARS